MGMGRCRGASTANSKSLAHPSKVSRRALPIYRRIVFWTGNGVTDLLVEVQDRDIVVRRPASGHSIIYRRVLDMPMLEAVDLMRRDPDREETEFLVQAWKAAYAKAKALGWL